MPTSPPTEPSPVAQKAFAVLRQVDNPFTFAVATAGTEERCRQYDVPELLDAQRSDLLAVVQQHRDQPTMPSRVIPVLGDPGSGKTHLLATFQGALEQEANAAGRECIVIVADHYPPEAGATDFFLALVVNHLLAHKGSGARQLPMIARRLTARLLAEAIRRKPINEQLDLIPTRGMVAQFRSFVGSGTAERITAIRTLADRCAGPGPCDPVEACREAGAPDDRVLRLIKQHLTATEPRNIVGNLRRELFSRLADFAFDPEQGRESLENFLIDDYPKAVSPTPAPETLPRQLLNVLVDLLQELQTPVVLVFDQLEDFLADADPERQRQRRTAFGNGLAAIVNHVPGLCLLVFAERGLWNDAVLNSMGQFVRDRIAQPFSLPGRPGRWLIDMPIGIDRTKLTDLIERRVRAVLGADFDPTGLSRAFPFNEDEVERIAREDTIRLALRRLRDAYDKVLYPPSPAPKQDEKSLIGLPPPPPPTPDYKTRFIALWKDHLETARRQLEGDAPRPSFIPEAQQALEEWIADVNARDLVPGGPIPKVELLVDPAIHPYYGHLTVVRFAGPDQPGVGVAAWLANKIGRPNDLRMRLAFFDRKPCPIRSLILFRHDGEDALTGDTRDIYEKARGKGRDVRVVRYDETNLQSLLAFRQWLQAVRGEPDASGPEAQAAYRDVLARISDRLLAWLGEWRQAGGPKP